MDIKELEELIKNQSAYIEQQIEDAKVFYEENNNRTYITSIEEYIELKSLGKIIEIE